jgi:hypothetical protein
MTIMSTLKSKLFPEPAHIVLEEVRNATGYARRQRYADAIAVSLWPSRGIWIAGIEIKTHRNDFLSEIKKPEKSAEIQKYCNYWWLACPPGVSLEHEIPKNWGLVYVENSKINVVKKAPELKAKPLDVLFVASILRKFHSDREKLVMVGREEAMESLSEKEKMASDVLHKVSYLENMLAQEKYRRETTEKALDAIQKREMDMIKDYGEGFPRECNAQAFRSAYNLVLLLEDFRTKYALSNLASLSDSILKEIDKIKEMSKGAHDEA